jgi:hypothetical protein
VIRVDQSSHCHSRQSARHTTHYDKVKLIHADPADQSERRLNQREASPRQSKTSVAVLLLSAHAHPTDQFFPLDPRRFVAVARLLPLLLT